MSGERGDSTVLMVAYQCGPGMGSVSQIGWEWFAGMSALREVTLVTHVRNRAALEAAPKRPADARIVYIDTEWFAGPLYRFSKWLFPRSEHAVFMISQLDWFVFDAVALRLLRREQKAGARWSVLHLVTPVSVSAPTRLHRLGPPMVRGPLNSGLPVPAGFKDLMRDDAMGLSKLRVFPRLIEAVFGSLRHSALVLVATAATRAALPRAVQPRAVAMLENAVDPSRFAPAPPLPPPGGAVPLRLCFVGRLVPVKALPLLMQAMVVLRNEGRAVELAVVGDGPMAAPWRAEGEALGLTAQVQWRGALPLAQVADAMRDCHVFCLPSVRESGGAVLLEAMACGRPAIGMDFGGPAEIVDAEVGWKVPASTPEVAVRGLAEALREAYDDPAGANRRGATARARVLERYTWEAKMREASAIYDGLVSKATRPGA